MHILETTKTSLGNLVSNKIRTFLTTLGVIIGVFAVVTLISLVKGVQNYVTDQFSALGSNLVFVYPGSGGISQDPAIAFTSNKLGKKHIDLLNQYVPEHIQSTSPNISLGKTVKYKTVSYYGLINGVGSEYGQISNVETSEGRFFNKEEEIGKQKVAVIGVNVKKDIFGANTNAVGKEIKIDKASYKVVGVMKQKSSDFDEQLLIPYTTVETDFGVKQYSLITVKLKDGENIDTAAREIEIAMLNDLKSDEYTIYTQKDLLNSIQSILDILTIALGAVAGISLLVGGIGIMNIMLVSVTERIREIGLRKALGATSWNIAIQFMIESITLSLIGGTVGLLLGWGGTLIAQNWIRAEITPWAVILAFGFSVFVGVVFGTYPAVQASKKDPIEALRYE